MYVFGGYLDKRYNHSIDSFSKKDALWLMRMCIGEGGSRCSRTKASAMLWSMVNRFILHPAGKKWVKLGRRHGVKDSDFLCMVRMFSQPINPRWSRGGDKAEQWKNTRFATEQRLNRRERICSMPESRMPDEVWESVYDFINGKLFPPDVLSKIKKSRISNWASLKSTPKKFPWGVDIGGDWFFEGKALRGGIVKVV